MGLLSGLFGGGGGGLSSGGVGNSSSSQTTQTNDGRVVGGADSTNSSTIITGGTNTLTSTDHGAVAGGLQLALAGIESASKLASQAQASSGDVLDGALKMAGEQQAKFASTLENIKTADIRVLILAGLAAVSIVAFVALRRN